MKRPVSGVLFDLGNTLAAYYHADQFQPVLEASVANVIEELRRRGRVGVGFQEALTAARAQNQEAPDFRVRPLAHRLARIFSVGPHETAVLAALSARFLEPIFALGRCFEDALPALEQLRAEGLRTGIVSNSPWGSSAQAWREELRRLRLLDAVDVTVFCGDVGWRKPARIIFDHAARLLQVPPAQCCFVGDDPKWDAEGAANAGMQPILLDRDGRHSSTAWPKAATLHQLTQQIAQAG
jgi:putative hydrolase of the HAD superfamily